MTRHHLGRSAPGVTAAVRDLVALHSSDPITPHLATWARVPGYATSDLDRELVDTRSLWRMHAMRRTLFVVTSDEVPIFQAAASDDVAKKERARVETWVAAAVRTRSVARWMARLEARVLEALADGSEQRARDLYGAIPELETPITMGSGKWSQTAAVGPRLLFIMAMEGRVVRTRSTSWRASHYRWAATATWLGHAPTPMAPAEARTELVRRYLRAHGPATLTDVRWWTGWTAKHAHAALADLGAVAVTLDGDGEGFVLPGDMAPVRSAPHVALLPGLDPTPMGWKERAWFLGSHRKLLFDTNGNVGPTVWVDGRIVGGWAQRSSGEVVVRLLERVSKRSSARVTKEAAALQAWLGDATVLPRFRTPLEKELSTS